MRIGVASEDQFSRGVVSRKILKGRSFPLLHSERCLGHADCFAWLLDPESIRDSFGGT
jgi:hypothetical protein